MNQDSLTSVPNSLKQQLERASNLLSQSERADSQGDHALALIKAKEGLRVLRVLAQTSPTLATLVMAAENGYQGLEWESIERVDRHQLVERRFMGIGCGYEVVNVPTITRKSTRVRFI